MKNYHVADGRFRCPAQGIFTAIFKNQRDGLRQVRSGIFHCLALSVGSRNFRTVCNVPIAVSFDDRRKLVVHKSYLTATYTLIGMPFTLANPSSSASYSVGCAWIVNIISSTVA